MVVTANRVAMAGLCPAAMKGTQATRRQTKKDGLRPIGVVISSARIVGRNGDVKIGITTQ
jgi:YHS domain-containing protein